jgi:hypothetical protein
LSRSNSAPTAIALDSNGTFTGKYSLPISALGYLDLPATPASDKAYGIYVTGAAPEMGVGYLNGPIWVTAGVLSETTTTPTKTATLGFISYAGADWMIEMIGTADTATSFDVTVQEAAVGGPSLGSATAVALGTPTWVGASPNNAYFGPIAVGTGQELVINLGSLTQDVNMTLHDSSGTAMGRTVGFEDERYKNDQYLGLPAGNYYVRIYDLSVWTSDAAVGRLTVTVN